MDALAQNNMNVKPPREHNWLEGLADDPERYLESPKVANGRPPQVALVHHKAHMQYSIL